jgi:hypothetical protein
MAFFRAEEPQFWKKRSVMIGYGQIRLLKKSFPFTDPASGKLRAENYVILYHEAFGIGFDLDLRQEPVDGAVAA